MILSSLLLLAVASATKSRFIPGPEDNTIDNQNGQLRVAPFAVDTPELVIGGIFSLSNNGTRLPNESGVQRAIAFECAIESVNNGQVGFQMPTKFFYNIQDDGSSAPWAVRAAVRLQNDGVPVVVGPSSSDQAVSTAPVYGSLALPLLSPAATSDSLSDTVNFPSFFRLVPADVAQARAIAAACVYFNWSLITPIYTSDEYGISGSLAFSAEANRNRISFTCGRTIRPGETNGIQNTNLCLDVSDSNVVLLYMAASDASNVIAEMYSDESNGRLTFLASDAWADIQDFRLFSRNRFPPSFLEGALGFAPELGDQKPYRQCASTYTPGNNDIPNFDRFWEITFRCSLNPESALPDCPKGIYRDRDYTRIACKCNGDESLSQVPPDVEFRFNE
jgi:ABC-type branched-subunit amino acid transport system substrate-binding protein